MRTATHPFDPAEHLGTAEAQAENFYVALDPAFITDSLSAVARVRAPSMSRLARDIDPI